MVDQGLKPPRVLVVEDDLPLRTGLESALEGEGFEVLSAADGSAIEEVATTFRPDIALLDVRLDVGPDGYDIARLLRKTSDLPVLFLTAADSVGDRLAGFEAGADDYVVKPFVMGELLARIRAVLRRTGRLISGAWQAGDLVIDEAAREVVRSGHPVSLTRTEYELLLVLVRNLGKTVSKVQIMNEVWGYDAIGRNIVEVHLCSLRRKLETHGPRIVHTVHGNYYRLQV